MTKHLLFEWHKTKLETQVAASTLWDYYRLQISCVLSGVECLSLWLNADAYKPKRESLPTFLHQCNSEKQTCSAQLRTATDDLGQGSALNTNTI